MNAEPLRLPMSALLEINAALVAGHKAAKALFDQHVAGTFGFNKDLHLAVLAAQDACIVFDVWFVQKLPIVEVMVAA